MHRLIRALACAAIVAVGSARANMGANDTASSNPDFAAGRQAIEAQDWPGAIAALKKAVAADPNNADGHNWLGFAYRKSGNYDAAFSAYAEALRLEPRHR
ncbi:MAG: tetratricopeptide repeat protein, partial [Burkholderiales bacterium]|nr:tetratricopeptide repeat protein [Burkholderiales bacterium]